MKAKVLITFLLLSAISFSQTFQQDIPDSYGFKVELGQTVPNFTLELPDGTKTTIEELRGKVIMLQFTASWCSVCRKEMPHIEKDIWQKHKDNKDFALYGIDLQERSKNVVDFQQQIGTTYPLALDVDGDIFYTFAHENAGVTRNVIIDHNGKIVFMTRLFKQEEFKQMVDVIDALLEK